MSIRSKIKKVFIAIVIAVAAGFLVIQLFQIDKTNVPVVMADSLESAVAVPPDIAQIIGRSCSDCHSNNTVYPLYTYIQPAGWFMKNHVDDGRKELNFSVFKTYSPRKKAKKLEEICEQVSSGEMPLPSYLWIHWDASLKETEKQALCDWSKQATMTVNSEQ